MVSFNEHKEKEFPTPVGGNILVVDALNLAFRWKHMGKTDFKYDYLRTVESLARSYNCTNIIITADKGYSSFRREIYPEYKANRKDRFADQTEKEREEFQLFIAEFEETLNDLQEKYLVLRYTGVEADDLAAYIVKEFAEGREIWLISSDRDWDLLVRDNVSRFSTVTRKETTMLNWDEHYDVDPEEYICYKCLTGDSGDNVPGIPGIGPKRAAQLIKEHGTAVDIYAACPIDSKYKYIQSLNENCEQILINYELMDLETFCEDAIGAENIEHLRESVLEYLNEA